MRLTLLALVALMASPLLMAGSVYVPALTVVGVGWIVLVAAAAVADATLARRVPLHVERNVEQRLSLGGSHTVRLRLRNRGRRAVWLRIKDTPPAAFHAPLRLLQATLPGFAEVEAAYPIIPLRRGDHCFGAVYVQGRGPLGLGIWQRRFELPQPVRVYPNLQEVERYERLLRLQRLTEVGIETLRGRGEGTQFESLRDYVDGDPFRNIDWKATARRGKPITRQYEVDRSQTVLLMLDTGRMMTSEPAGEGPVRLSKLDYSINAALLLAHVAVAHGDAVGLLVFGGRVQSFVPPRKGHGQVARLMEQMVPLQPELEEPDYAAAFATLGQRARKRALIVLFTDLVDAQASERLLAHVAALRTRHLPLLVTQRDADVEHLAQAAPAEIEDAYRRGIATQLLQEREIALARLRSRGVLVVDVAPGKLTVSAVNEYLRLKQTGKL
jgi:uncharacterized protein (DUF58 family)